MTEMAKNPGLKGTDHENDFIPEEIEKLLTPIVEDKELGSKEKVAFIARRVIETQELFSGPIPSPRIMEQYENILPGAADRIMKMAESQSTHRMDMEKTVIPEQVRQSARGQHYAFIIALVLIGAAFYALHCGNGTVAAIIFTGTLIGVLSLFLTGKRAIRKDLKEKAGETD